MANLKISFAKAINIMCPANNKDRIDNPLFLLENENKS